VLHQHTVDKDITATNSAEDYTLRAVVEKVNEIPREVAKAIDIPTRNKVFDNDNFMSPAGLLRFLVVTSLIRGVI